MEPVYLTNVTTLQLDVSRCSGCGMCLLVCPRAVIARAEDKVAIAHLDACLECGACARNCPAGAVTVRQGVGCAYAVMRSKLRRNKSACCGSDCGCSIDDYQ